MCRTLLKPQKQRGCGIFVAEKLEKDKKVQRTETTNGKF